MFLFRMLIMPMSESSQVCNIEIRWMGWEDGLGAAIKDLAVRTLRVPTLLEW